MKIIFATNNAHKLQEIRQILGKDIEVLSLADIHCQADIPETADTLEGNALQKAQYIWKRYATPVFADDTGLEVDALDGAPGVHSARYAEGPGHDSEANMDKLLHELQRAAQQGRTSRKAHFRTVIALITPDTLSPDAAQVHCFEGRVDGTIATQRKGTQGFGYDPLFVPEGHTQSFAELGDTVKNTISHRARAVEKLATFLKSQRPQPQPKA